MLDGKRTPARGQPPPPPISPYDLHITLAERWQWPDFVVDALDPEYIDALVPYLKATTDHARLEAERLKRKHTRRE